jgi:hypothetical protein
MLATTTRDTNLVELSIRPDILERLELLSKVLDDNSANLVREKICEIGKTNFTTNEYRQNVYSVTPELAKIVQDCDLICKSIQITPHGFLNDIKNFCTFFTTAYQTLSNPESDITLLNRIYKNSSIQVASVSVDSLVDRVIQGLDTQSVDPQSGNVTVSDSGLTVDIEKLKSFLVETNSVDFIKELDAKLLQLNLAYKELVKKYLEITTENRLAVLESFEQLSIQAKSIVSFIDGSNSDLSDLRLPEIPDNW